MRTIDVGRKSDHLAELLDQILARKGPIRLDRKEGPSAVLVPIEDFELIERLKANALTDCESQRQKSHALFEETESLARCGHWEWDEVEDRCIYCSEELARLHGLTVQEYLACATSIEADAQSVHPDDREGYLAAFADKERNAESIELGYRLLQPDGGWIHVREVTRPIFDDTGTLVRSHGFVQDVTAQTKREQALRDNATLMRQAAELAGIGYWIWDEIDEKCVFCSDNLAAMNGVTVEEYLKDLATMADILPIIHPEDRVRYEEVINEAHANMAAYDIEFRALLADGGYRYLRERAEPEVGPQGVPLRTIGIVQDITAQLGFGLLRFEMLCGFQIHTTEAAQLIFG